VALVRLENICGQDVFCGQLLLALTMRAPARPTLPECKGGAQCTRAVRCTDSGLTFTPAPFTHSSGREVWSQVRDGSRDTLHDLRDGSYAICSIAMTEYVSVEWGAQLLTEGIDDAAGIRLNIPQLWTRVCNPAGWRWCVYDMQVGIVNQYRERPRDHRESRQVVECSAQSADTWTFFTRHMSLPKE